MSFIMCSQLKKSPDKSGLVIKITLNIIYAMLILHLLHLILFCLLEDQKLLHRLL